MKTDGSSFKLPYYFATIVIVMVFIVGCKTFKPQVREMSPVPLPKTYSLYVQNDSMPDQWWKSFNSNELNMMMDTALKKNFSIQIAKARLAQVKAEAKKIDSDRYPFLDFNASASHQRSQVKNKNVRAQTTSTEDYTLGLAAGYEIDLWGRLSSLEKSAGYETLAVRDDLAVAMMTVAAEISDTWINVIALRNEIGILRQQIKTNENLLNIQLKRLESGLASALDVSQQMESVEAVRAEMPPLLSREKEELNILAFLLGMSSPDTIRILDQALPDLIPLPDTGIPVDLISRRPDVRAAGYRLTAADWQIAAARANRLPSISLTADGAFSSSNPDLLFSNWLAALAANLTAPILDSGKRSAEVVRVKAVADERLAQYGETVALAVKEVESGLWNETNQRQYMMLLEKQISAARLAMDEAKLQYLRGQSAFLNYLIEIRNVQRLERQIITVKADLIKYRIGLYRALCGSWADQLIKNDF